MGKLPTEATLKDIDLYVRRIEGYVDLILNGWTTHDWAGLKRLVDDGIAEHEYPVASQIIDTWAKDANTTLNIPWDVVHYSENGDMFLKWHYAFPDGVQFDAPEAIYYFDGTEAAGTYHIPIGTAYGDGWTVGKSIQFTLSEAPAEGDQIVIDCGTNNANDPTAGRTWRVYAAGDATVKQSGTTSNGTDGTHLGTIGDVNAHRTNGRINAISRVVYGYGRWSQSAIRHWLNSAAVANGWWTMQNAWDRPPAQLATLRGFLAGFTDDFLAVLEETEVVTALNTQEGFTETTETTYDKIFLPSLQEMYINPQLANVEGEDWDYFKELAEEAGLPGKFQQYQTYPILISYNAQNTTSPVGVWLRSCYRGYATYAWVVHSSGYVTYYYACYALRGCPACKLRKSA